MKRHSYRQGDIYIKPIESINVENCIGIQPDKDGRLILAEGEATGHAHAIKNPNAILLKDKNSNRLFLIIKKEEVPLQHEEHSDIPILPGNYEVIRQRQYNPQEVRYVAD